MMPLQLVPPDGAWPDTGPPPIRLRAYRRCPHDVPHDPARWEYCPVCDAPPNGDAAAA